MVQRMPKFVEERGDVLVREQGRLVADRR